MSDWLLSNEWNCSYLTLLENLLKWSYISDNMIPINKFVIVIRLQFNSRHRVTKSPCRLDAKSKYVHIELYNIPWRHREEDKARQYLKDIKGNYEWKIFKLCIIDLTFVTKIFQCDLILARSSSIQPSFAECQCSEVFVNDVEKLFRRLQSQRLIWAFKVFHEVWYVHVIVHNTTVTDIKVWLLHRINWREKLLLTVQSIRKFQLRRTRSLP